MFQLVPHSFGMEKPPVIDNLKLLTQKIEMISVHSKHNPMPSSLHWIDSDWIGLGQTLGDIEVASALMSSNATADQSLHPLDNYYKLLHCDIEYIDPDTYEAQLIKRFFFFPFLQID